MGPDPHCKPGFVFAARTCARVSSPSGAAVLLFEVCLFIQTYEPQGTPAVRREVGLILRTVRAADKNPDLS